MLILVWSLDLRRTVLWTAIVLLEGRATIRRTPISGTSIGRASILLRLNDLLMVLGLGSISLLLLRARTLVLSGWHMVLR